MPFSEHSNPNDREWDDSLFQPFDGGSDPMATKPAPRPAAKTLPKSAPKAAAPAKPAPKPAQKPAPKPAPPPAEEREDLLDDPTDEQVEEAAAEEEEMEPEADAAEGGDGDEGGGDGGDEGGGEEVPDEEDPDSEPDEFDLPERQTDANKTAEDLRKEGGLIPAGTYHVQVDEAVIDKSSVQQTPFLGLQLRVLAGEHEQRNVGKYACQLYLTDGSMPQVDIAALAFRVIKAGESYKPGVAFAKKFEGRQAIVTVEHQPIEKKDENGVLKATGRFSARIAYGGFYDINDPEVADVECNEDALAEIGITRKVKKPAAPPAKPAAGKGAKPGQKPAGKKNWDD